jgi:hypothetical protein
MDLHEGGGTKPRQQHKHKQPTRSLKQEHELHDLRYLKERYTLQKLNNVYCQRDQNQVSALGKSLLMFAPQNPQQTRAKTSISATPWYAQLS